MTLSDLLVYIDNTDASANRIRAAQMVAAQFDAHIAGLFVIRPVYFPIYAEVPIPTNVVAEAEAHQKEMARLAKTEFENLTSAWESKVSWHVEEGVTASAIIKHARLYDLAVVGQPNPDDISDDNEGIADRVALESGGPVLVIPHIGAKETIGDRILVAWNGKREAVRAVRDALPFLEKASAVDIVSVNTPENVDFPGADIAEHLARHGVTVETEKAHTNGIDVGDLLLSMAADYGADTIVMGAYGHSRYREMILGGATRQVLKSMTIPVLMAH